MNKKVQYGFKSNCFVNIICLDDHFILGILSNVLHKHDLLYMWPFLASSRGGAGSTRLEYHKKWPFLASSWRRGDLPGWSTTFIIFLFIMNVYIDLHRIALWKYLNGSSLRNFREISAGVAHGQPTFRARNRLPAINL